MTINDILSLEKLNLPLKLSNDDFIKSLTIELRSYTSTLNSISGNNPFIDITKSEVEKVKKLSDSIIKVFSYYLDGKVTSAYNSFKFLMKSIESELTSIRLEDRKHNLVGIENMYRLRTSDKSRLSQQEMFHVPYSQRRKVNSYRFSIPGLPSLYLGSSSYICWEELSRPLLDNLHISKFSFSEEYKYNLLNISLNNKLLLTYLEKYPENNIDDSSVYKALLNSIKTFLLLWPFIASCHIKVKEPTQPFKPEYILPQILMQYIVNDEGYDGVLYSSTRTEANKVHPSKCINLAIPAKKQQNKNEYCIDLVDKFRMTDPVSIKFYRTIIHKGLASYDPYDFEIVPGLGYHYLLSDFGYIEKAVNDLNLNQLAQTIK